MAVNKVVYGNNTLIDLTGDTVDAASLAKGVTAHDRSGAVITGTSTKDSDTSDATAAASEILETKTAYVAGAKVTGSMTNRGGASGTLNAKDSIYTIQSGYHDGSGTVQLDNDEKAKLIPENIKAGISILSVVGTYSGGTVTAQAKEATPAAQEQLITPDSGYDYLSQVKVKAIPYSEQANPQGGLTVTIG